MDDPIDVVQFRIAAVLDNHLRAAATKDVVSLLSSFAPGSYFVGTDDTEQWPIAKLAQLLRDSEGGWDMSRCLERSIFPLGGGDHAAFHEMLVHQQYGVMRGSGVVSRNVQGNWEIAHYVLSFSIPNATAENPAFVQLLNHQVSKD